MYQYSRIQFATIAVVVMAVLGGESGQAGGAGQSGTSAAIGEGEDPEPPDSIRGYPRDEISRKPSSRSLLASTRLTTGHGGPQPGVGAEPNATGPNAGAGGGHAGQGNGTRSGRYHVAQFDFARLATPFVVSVWLILAICAKIVFHLNNKLSSYVPESCMLILVGVVLGLILYFSGTRGYSLDANTFFFYLLPPIVLEAGYFMPSRALFDNIGTILTFAVVATLLHTLLLGFSLWGLSLSTGAGVIPIQLDMLHCLVFAALLSAVDPVAVLAIFDEIHVNEILHIVVFGESLLNDGVTVVLYHMFVEYSHIDVQPIDIVAGVASFVVVATCGTLLGVLFGLLTALVSRFTSHVPLIQPLLIMVMGYLSYLTAEMFHLSGILACTFCGITMKKYVEANISRKSHTTIKHFLKMLASVCETVIFMYLGISTVVDNHHWDTAFVLLSLLLCLVFRTIVVVVLTSLLNLHRLPRLGFKDQLILSYGGLRGAVAFSLVILLDEKHFPQRNLFITTTVVVVYFTNFIQLVDHLMAAVEDITGHFGHHELREKFAHLDNRFLKPVLIKRSSSKQKMPGWSILQVYEKLNESDIRAEVAWSDSNPLLHGLHSGSFHQSSVARILSQLPSLLTTKSYSEEHHSGTQLDLKALEAQSSRKMRDDSRSHHILEDGLFQPRKRFTQQQRHMLPADPVPHHHHTARLHLRHLLSRAPHLPNAPASTNGHVHDVRPRKNVSFAEVTEVANADADMGSTQAESGGEDYDQDDADIGITFTAICNDAEEQSAQCVPMEPVAIETSLPWKRNTGRQPMSSQVTHCMPDDYHPLLGEAPSWIDSPYKHPASPKPCAPLTDAVENQDPKEGFDNLALDQSTEMDSRDDLSSAFSGHVSHGSSMDCDVEADNKEPLVDGKHQRVVSGVAPPCEEGATLPFPWVKQCESSSGCCADAGLCSRVSACSHSETSLERDHHPKAHPHEHHPHAPHPDMAVVKGVVGAMPPPPWRDFAHIGEVKRDGGAPRCAPHQPPHTLPTDAHPHQPPLPWRHNPEPTPANDLALRSPSSFDLEAYSLRPQPSSHSFRLSEAESRHSEPYHCHHILDSAACSRPILELEPGTDGDLELENDDMDTHDRVLLWLRDIDPEPLSEEELNVAVSDDSPTPTPTAEGGTKPHSEGGGDFMDQEQPEQDTKL